MQDPDKVSPGAQPRPPSDHRVETVSNQAPLSQQSLLDLSALRLPQNFGDLAGVKKVIMEVPIRKPRPDVFVRTHPNPGFRGTFTVVTDKDTGECYVVHVDVIPYVGTDAVPTILQTAMDRAGNLFLWPLRLPKDDGRTDRWAISAIAASEHASRSWVRVKANMGAGAFDVYEAQGSLPGPEWPSEKSYDDLLGIALKGRVIDSPDHPLVRRLQGLS